jgi:integrase
LDKEIILAKYAENLSNASTRNVYLAYARDFLEHTNNLDRAAVDRYLNGLRRKGRKPGTINFVFRVIRRIFTVNGLEWEYRRGEAPPIGQRDEYRPQLSTDIIRVMVEAAISGKLHEDESCFLACSTVYGLRREEMINLKPDDVDLANDAIYVSTVKMGRQRYHQVPPAEIKPYLAAHDFSKRYSLTGMSQLFWMIVNNSGLGGLKSQRLGWHAIRRAVLDGLIDNGVNGFAARAFLRWKGSSSAEMAMPERYYGNVVVDLNGSTSLLEEAAGDEEIFQKHPFLPMWRGGLRLL